MMAPLTHGVAPPLAALSAISLAEVATRVNSIWLGRAVFLRTALPALRKVGTVKYLFGPPPNPPKFHFPVMGTPTGPTTTKRFARVRPR